MLLAVDVGNTQTLAGLFSGGELLHEWRIATDRTATADVLAAHHDQILRLRGGGLEALEAMVVCSVVPTVTAGYVDLARKYLDREALVLGPGVRTGIRLAIDNPHELGADRLANAVAAYAEFGGPCIVVDFGTATTLDAVSAEGEYLGGAIAPGIETSLAALAQRADRLIQIDLVPPDRVIGKSTLESMRSGAVFGTVAMVDGMVRMMREELGPEAIVVATGGLAALVCRFSDEIDEHRPLLTLEGLRRVFELNSPPAATEGSGERPRPVSGAPGSR